MNLDEAKKLEIPGQNLPKYISNFCQKEKLIPINLFEENYLDGIAIMLQCYDGNETRLFIIDDEQEEVLKA